MEENNLNETTEAPVVTNPTVSPDVNLETTNERPANKKNKRFRSFVAFVLFVLSVSLILWFKDDVIVFVNKIFEPNIELSTFEPNEYYKNADYEYVQITDDFSVKTYQHLLNAYYTIVNAGHENFTFKCDESYENCLSDIQELNNADNVLSDINSFVHPYNSFDTIDTSTNLFGEIQLKISKSYTKEQIIAIDEIFKEILAEKTDPTKNHSHNIKVVHDHIINIAKYDLEKSDTGVSSYESGLAYGPLLQGYGLCKGYTDAMALFLDYYNIKNYKVISENHIWNALELDGKWYHLDLTWDDPINSDGTEETSYTYFMIDDKELYRVRGNQHYYNSDIFNEVSAGNAQ